MLAATEVYMRIIVICHRRFGMHQFCHAAFSAHCFKHIPKGDAAFGCNVLLITNQILHTGHGTKFAVLVFRITVADAQQQDSCLWETFFQMLDSCEQSFLIVIIITSPFSSYIQTIFEDNEVVRTLTVKLFQHLWRNAPQRKTGTATQREVVENDSFLSIHCQTIEQCRICTVYCPTDRANAPVYLDLLQSVGRA